MSYKEKRPEFLDAESTQPVASVCARRSEVFARVPQPSGTNVTDLAEKNIDREMIM
jgi:hypothetical protein